MKEVSPFSLPTERNASFKERHLQFSNRGTKLIGSTFKFNPVFWSINQLNQLITEALPMRTVRLSIYVRQTKYNN